MHPHLGEVCPQDLVEGGLAMDAERGCYTMLCRCREAAEAPTRSASPRISMVSLCTALS
jgi:hypothetical protein